MRCIRKIMCYMKNKNSVVSIDVLRNGKVTTINTPVSDNGTIYYQSLLNIDFPAPPLGPDGAVLDSILNQQEIILDDEVYYFTRDNIQYLIPRFVFSSELDTITLQPDNSLKINSSIMFRLLSTGLLEEEE